MVDINGSEFIPSLKTLRYISKYIGVLSTEDAIEFLEDCGVPSNQIEPHESSAKIIYHVLKKLATSDQKKDHELLVKIISESISTALYEQDGLSENDIFEMYNKWLQIDGQQLYLGIDHQYRITIPLPKSAERRRMEREVVRQDYEIEIDILNSILKPYITDIAEIRVAYSLIINIINIFSQQSFPVDKQLNDYYIKLFNLVKEKIDTILAELKRVYEQENLFDTPPSDYINPYIYEDTYGEPILSRPFTNLYLAAEEMKQKQTSWDDIKKQMDVCFGLIENIYFEFEADNVKSLPEQKLLDEIAQYLEHSVRADYGDYFGFKDCKFWLKRIHNRDLEINLPPQKAGGVAGAYCLMRAYIEYIESGNYSNGWLEVVIPKATITNYVRKNFKIDPPKGDWNQWIADSKNGLKHKIDDEARMFINVGNYNNGKDGGGEGYSFSIKLPIKDTFTS